MKLSYRFGDELKSEMRTRAPSACIISESMVGHAYQTRRTKHSRADYLASIDAIERPSWELSSQSLEDLASKIMTEINGTKLVVCFVTLKETLGWHQVAVIVDIRQDQVFRSMLYDPHRRTHNKNQPMQEPLLPGPVQELLRMCNIERVDLVRGSQASDLECVIHVICFVKAILDGHTVWNEELIEGTWDNGRPRSVVAHPTNVPAPPVFVSPSTPSTTARQQSIQKAAMPDCSKSP